MFEDLEVDHQSRHGGFDWYMSHVCLNETQFSCRTQRNLPGECKHLPRDIESDYSFSEIGEGRRVPPWAATGIDCEQRLRFDRCMEKLRLPAMKVAMLVPYAIDDVVIRLCNVVEMAFKFSQHRGVQFNAFLILLECHLR